MTEMHISRCCKAGQREIALMSNSDGKTEVELELLPEGEKYEG